MGKYCDGLSRLKFEIFKYFPFMRFLKFLNTDYGQSIKIFDTNSLEYFLSYFPGAKVNSES